MTSGTDTAVKMCAIVIRQPVAWVTVKSNDPIKIKKLVGPGRAGQLYCCYRGNRIAIGTLHLQAPAKVAKDDPTSWTYKLYRSLSRSLSLSLYIYIYIYIYLLQVRDST